MTKIGSTITNLSEVSLGKENSGETAVDKKVFDEELAKQRSKIGTPIVKTAELEVPTIQLGKVMTAASSDTGENAAVYETTRTVGLGDLVNNLSGNNSFGAESSLKSMLESAPDRDLPEVAIVSADAIAENSVTFKSAVIGDTMFLSDTVYDNWVNGKDEGQLEQALEGITASWLDSK